MSKPVRVEQLADVVASYGATAFLLTTSDDGRPHATHVVVGVEGAVLTCELGRRTAANGVARPLVSLLWPAPAPGEFSLIVDGNMAVAPAQGDLAAVGTVTATNAVMHRPAQSDPAADAVCGSDCVDVVITES